MANRKIAFSYYGGKFKHLDFLLPLFPSDAIHFVDVFGGSASVLLNLPKKYPIQTYNDLDGNVVNFFRVLRENTTELIYQLKYTPHSREEYMAACEATLGDSMDPIERARLFWVRITQSIRPIVRDEKKHPTWKISHTESYGSHTSRINNKFDGLYDIAERLMDVSIENLPAIELIQEYDRDGVLFYCDPPYVHKSRNSKHVYPFEMTDDDHVELHSVLSSCRGRVVLSGYQNELYQELYQDWDCIKDKPKKIPSSIGNSVGQECAWLNFELSAKQQELFQQ